MDDRQVRTIVDQFVSQFGFTPLGARWLEANRTSALLLLQRVLEQHLAYGVERLASFEAATLAGEFLDLFPGGSRYFTNGTLGWHWIGEPPPPNFDLGNCVWGSWNPIAEGFASDRQMVLDTGIITISRERIGLLWIVDQE
jgi:hypothetical protein